MWQLHMMNFYYLKDQQSVVKQMKISNNVIQGAFEICSQNGLKKTHSKAVIMTKEHETVEKPLRAFEFIRRKTKA